MLLAAVLEAGTPVHAQPFSYVNTTALHTNVATSSGTITMPGLTTNQSFTTVVSNYTIGDSLATAFGKVNNNFAFIANWMGTNESGVYELTLTNAGGTYISVDGSTLVLNTNGFGGGGGSGGGVTNVVSTNGVSIIIGGTLFLSTNGLSGGNINGTNPIFTNSVTIVNPNVVNYSLLSVTVSGYSNACINGTYTNDATACVLTNQCGFIFSLINPDGSGTINGGATNLNYITCLAAVVSGCTENTNVNNLYNEYADVSFGPYYGLKNPFFPTGGAASYALKRGDTGFSLYGSTSTNAFVLYSINCTTNKTLLAGSTFTLNSGGAWGAPYPTVTFYITNVPAFIPNFMCNTQPTPIAGGSSTVSFPYAIIQGNGTETSGVYTNYTITVVSGNSGMNTPNPTSYIGLQTDCCNQNALGGVNGGWGIYDPLQNLCKIVVTPTQTNKICNCCYPTNLAPVTPLSPP